MMIEKVVCKTGIHCERCLSDKNWRDSIADTHGPFVCPNGHGVGSDKVKGWKGSKKELKEQKKKKTLRSRKSCVYIINTNEQMVKGCGCKKIKIVCSNPEVVEMNGGKEFIKQSVEQTGSFPPGWDSKKCNPERCKFYEEKTDDNSVL